MNTSSDFEHGKIAQEVASFLLKLKIWKAVSWDKELFKVGLERTDFCTRSVVEFTLHWVLSYTRGHVFSFLKLSEYLLKLQKQKCIDQDLETLVCGAEFFDSNPCRGIISRLF